MTREKEKVAKEEEEVLSSLEELLVLELRKKKKKIAFAESCTAGAVAARLVNVPGASEVLECGFVTYSDRIKHKVLGVKKRVLRKQGAVSAKCAKQMAKGCLKASDADAAVSVTGLAGPGGGTEQTPVGTVFIAFASRKKIRICEYHFEGNRKEIRDQAIHAALELALQSV